MPENWTRRFISLKKASRALMCCMMENKLRHGSLRKGMPLVVLGIYIATHSTKVNERMVQDWAEDEEIYRTYALPVKIEDSVWIGGGAILLPGVTIGKNSVIGAGSVVTRSIPANCVAVGNPCRVIKQIEGNE